MAADPIPIIATTRRPKRFLVHQIQIGNSAGSWWPEIPPPSLVLAARTAVAAVVSYLIVRLFRLPEAYWAPISTVIGMGSTLGAALPVSVQHFAGTAIGAAVGAVTATYLHGSIWTFGA